MDRLFDLESGGVCCWDEIGARLENCRWIKRVLRNGEGDAEE